MYAGTALPKKAPGQFPYKEGGSLYTIPLSDLNVMPGDTLYIAAHAVVQNGEQEETAWGAGDEFGKSWATYLRYRVCDASPNHPLRNPNPTRRTAVRLPCPSPVR